jgi:hypothetical protein
MMVAPGLRCLPVGFIERDRDVVGRRRSWVLNNGNMEPPGFLPTLTSPCLRNSSLAA